MLLFVSAVAFLIAFILCLFAYSLVIRSERGLFSQILFSLRVGDREKASRDVEKLCKILNCCPSVVEAYKENEENSKEVYRNFLGFCLSIFIALSIFLLIVVGLISAEAGLPIITGAAGYGLSSLSTRRVHNRRSENKADMNSE
ncbi:hypothetical protein GCM10022228_11570 [Halomonas cibimaris]|uniref:DUF2721 domain-containing protein n=1 Tax=Halomonas cibimaris TaxID=657012 RepID=A0ABP7LNA4_9GAMM